MKRAARACWKTYVGVAIAGPDEVVGSPRSGLLRWPPVEPVRSAPRARARARPRDPPEASTPPPATARHIFRVDATGGDAEAKALLLKTIPGHCVFLGRVMITCP